MRHLLEAYVESQLNTILSAIGSVGWVVAVVAAGIALFRRAHAPRSASVVALLVLSAPLIAIHVTPFGPVGLAMFIVAELLVVRAQAETRAPVQRVQPTPA